MIPKRIGRDDVSASTGSDEHAILAFGAVNGAAHPFGPNHRQPAASDDHKLSIFWRVFGGAIVSIIALVGITIYNNLSGSIAELRAELSRVNEARAEMVKKDEFNTRSTSIWNRLQELQTVQVAVTSLKEQCAALAERNGNASRESKEASDGLRATVGTLKEKLTGIDQHLKTADEDHKALIHAQMQIASMSEKAASREAQFKAAEDDRKALAKELQELRERVAKLEGLSDRKPSPKAAANPTPGRNADPDE